jgi:hypothetical protein
MSVYKDSPIDSFNTTFALLRSDHIEFIRNHWADQLQHFQAPQNNAAVNVDGEDD